MKEEKGWLKEKRTTAAKNKGIFMKIKIFLLVNLSMRNPDNIKVNT
mgnify:CR=1